MRYESVDEFLEVVTKRNPCQPEYLQAVSEVIHSLWPFITKNPHYAEDALLERLVEPERIIQFRVCWVDDNGLTQVNRGYRVQHNSAIGPYKGGLRFHPSVDPSVLKFLAFEQTLKNSLTTLPMGSGKGGSDFNPKGKSKGEVMRFCQAFMTELYRYIGSDTDVPAGDIGVGAREIGYLAGMFKKITNRTDCVFTGKDLSFGGSLIRPEATGYGLVYFAQEMLLKSGCSIEGLRVGISGSGNVAQHAVEKALQLGARVVSVSDSAGSVYDEKGFTTEKLSMLKRIKNEERGRIEAYAKEAGLEYFPKCTPWHFKMDVALPCATQNELNIDDAQLLVQNGVQCVAEGANMPCSPAAIAVFENNGILFAPGKACNAGGVATSGLEMSQNAMRLSWTRDEVDTRLLEIMKGIHKACLRHGTRENGSINYVDGANIAGFVKVADAMLAQGII
ncbi:MAG TPA: NADP-specific glutamate dehydrogenase [Oceanospirillales bacterium]|jgi:glutamate dehydrogenase (NADP+)|uniref:NADP-specific glutamate dehydrogenase n=1 Tax=Methylophaga sp. UBA678 TaxID=1946901 RepID=UPI000EE06ACD|nr:NADP-specific glutamate dehydrogenase [Methylophaga sp. UBA678]HCM04792.1 NADP-specific glutamate dehydrogenase [Oceanospirillales bacterium]|tara:strand:- start:2669 stop:4012 length:1344 start_codon:yes stop_codon:yes gene_type:complete